MTHTSCLIELPRIVFSTNSDGTIGYPYAISYVLGLGKNICREHRKKMKLKGKN